MADDYGWAVEDFFCWLHFCNYLTILIIKGPEYKKAIKSIILRQEKGPASAPVLDGENKPLLD